MPTLQMSRASATPRCNSWRNTRPATRVSLLALGVGSWRWVTSAYYQGQSIRKSVIDVPPSLLPVKRYRILHRELPNTYVAFKTESPTTEAVSKMKGRSKKPANAAEPAENAPKGTGFLKLPAARGRIADNLVTGRPWYTDLTVPLIWDLDEMERQRKRQPGTSIERLWFQAICYQRSKLMKLIAKDDMWDTEAEKVFVEAFWEALDSLYAQEAAATERRQPNGNRAVRGPQRRHPPPADPGEDTNAAADGPRRPVRQGRPPKINPHAPGRRLAAHRPPRPLAERPRPRAAGSG